MTNALPSLPDADRVNQLIESIRQGPFDMAHCALCIGGHCEKLFHRWSPTTTLGLTPNNGIDTAIVIPSGYGRPDHYPPERAIRMLERLRDTGVVDWS